MTVNEVLKELESYSNEQTKKVLIKHGAKEPFFGVQVKDLKKLVKKIKKNHELSLELYATGNSDAMYLAGLVADKDQLTKAQLNDWADKAYWYYLSEFTVPWITSETEHGWELGLEWRKSEEERIAAAGWATLASFASINEDENLDIEAYKKLMHEAGENVHSAKNRVKYAMNGFVIATGSYIKELTDEALLVSAKIGKVYVQLGGVGCKVPLAKEYLEKIIDKDRVGKKRKGARC